MQPQRAEHALDRGLLVGREEHRRARWSRANASSSGLRQELRDRRSHLAVGADTRYARPFAPHSFAIVSSLARSPRESSWGTTRKRTTAAPAKTPNSEPRVTSGRVLDLEPEAEVRLVGPVLQHRLRVREPWERALGRLALERLEGGDDDALENLEDLVARRERELEVELAKLELPVCPEILVAPAGRDLVVAVEPADHAEPA